MICCLENDMFYSNDGMLSQQMTSTLVHPVQIFWKWLFAAFVMVINSLLVM
jgi:hypothetical protein